MIARSADGAAIAYEVAGAGAPLVLVHGWSCDRGHWAAQVAHFADRFRVVTIDLAGHGASAHGRDRHTIEGFGADVVAVLDAADLGPAVLVGHSMGADVVTETAATRPDLVTGLVWVDRYAWLRPTTPERVEARVAQFRTDFAPAAEAFARGLFGSDAHPDLVDRVARSMAAAPPVLADALFATFVNPGRVIDHLRELRIPVVAINQAEPPSDVAGLAAHGVTVLTTRPGVGHFPMLEDPAGFNAVLDDVLAGWGHPPYRNLDDR
jgi:pimeloyl-ACP methyl ester carboxylesterase